MKAIKQDKDIKKKVKKKEKVKSINKKEQLVSGRDSNGRHSIGNTTANNQAGRREEKITN